MIIIHIISKLLVQCVVYIDCKARLCAPKKQILTKLNCMVENAYMVLQWNPCMHMFVICHVIPHCC